MSKPVVHPYFSADRKLIFPVFTRDFEAISLFSHVLLNLTFGILPSVFFEQCGVMP